MRVITISQPFAWLISHGPKRAENRDWPTRYRGPILIHAGKGTQYLDDYDEMREDWWPHLNIPAWEEVPKGAVVALADLFDCLPMFEARDRYRSQAEWISGYFCLMLRDVRPLLNPVPWKVAQSLWTPPPELVRLVEAQLGEIR